jgi:hypothetical protein
MRTRFRLAAFVLLAGAAACASSFPRRGADLPATLETLLAVKVEERPRVEIRHLRVFDAGSEPWGEVPSAELESGRFAPEPEGDYAVVTELDCSWRSRQEVHTGEAITWYYFLDGALYAFEHVEFEDHCRRVPEIRGVAPGSDLRERMRALLDS